MAAKKAARKTSATRAKTRAKKAKRKSTRSKSGASRKRLTPAKEKRGLHADELPLALDAPEIAALRQRVEEVGGAAIGAYREPLCGHPVLLATLPLTAIEPTPFQRDLSPTHTKNLAVKIDESGSFLDPVIAVQGPAGRFWSPNGRHRLAAAKVLGLRQITALISTDEELAFRILALNTEKAHNLKDRSLEVIRMARELAARSKRTSESSYANQFEAPELLTLGIVYEQQSRFAGGAYRPLLRKVDRFSDRSLIASLRERSGWAARLLSIDSDVKEIIEALRERGFRSPYLRNYVVARINPVRFHRAKRGENEPPMAIGATLTRMAAAARKFNVESVRESDLALVAAAASGEDG